MSHATQPCATTAWILATTGTNRRPFEKVYVRKDGSRLPIIVAGAMLDEERIEGVAFVLDIADRKGAEESLRESEARYRLLYSQSKEAAAFFVGLVHRLLSRVGSVKSGTEVPEILAL